MIGLGVAGVGFCGFGMWMMARFKPWAHDDSLSAFSWFFAMVPFAMGGIFFVEALKLWRAQQ
jgi:hypothetical protein